MFIHKPKHWHLLPLLSLLILLVACPSLDTQTPNVALTSANSTVSVASQVTITANASDDTGVTKVEFFRGENKLGEDTSAPYEWNIPLTADDNGNPSFTAKAYDAIGNVTQSSPLVITVNIDAIPPTIMNRTPTSNATNVSLKEALKIQVTFSEAILANTVNATSITVIADGAQLSNTSTLSSDGLTLTIVPSGLNPQKLVTVNLSEKLTDLAGNALAATSWNFTVPTWLSIGDPIGNFTDEAGSASLTLDKSGRPFVTYIQQVNGVNNVFVKRWSGQSWEAVGESINNDPTKNGYVSIAVVLDKNDLPIVVWNELVNSIQNLFVKRWNGSSWESVGGSLNNNVNAYADFSSIAIDPNNNPVVAWQEGSASIPRQAFVKRWNGSSWDSIGGSLSINPVSNYPYIWLALTKIGNPIVAWVEGGPFQDSGGVTKLYVKRWTGSTWELLGSSLNTAANTSAGYPSLVLDGSDNPFVAWKEVIPGASVPFTSTIVVVKHWEGSSWTTIGGDASNGKAVGGLDYGSSRLSLVLDPMGFPVMASSIVENGQLTSNITHWTGNSWIPYGTQSLNNGVAFDNPILPSIALDTNGIPWVAFDLLRQVVVRRLNTL